MISLNKDVFAKLSEIKELGFVKSVNYSYPETFSNLPCITFYEINNSIIEFSDDDEYLSEINYVVDVWANDYEQLKSRLNFLCGEGENCNTNDILGKKGVVERSGLIRSTGLTFQGEKAYVATYPRAIADMILFHTKNCVPKNITLDEWTPREKEQKKILEYLNLALKSDRIDAEQKVRIKEWIKLQK